MTTAADQFVVEHLYFLSELKKFQQNKQLKSVLTETHNKLQLKGIINHTAYSQKEKVIFIWSKYKKTIAVAASIALIVSLFSATIITFFSHNKQNNIKPLVEKLKEQDDKYKKLEKQIGNLNIEKNKTENKPRVESKFRATGFLIDVNNNYVITNAHVLSEAKNQLFVENNKGEQYQVETVYTNIDNDLAILKIIDNDFKKLSPLPFTVKKSNADLGDQVFILGFPKQEIVYSEGYVSARNGYQMDTLYYQLNTSAHEGNSGSPVINKYGELVGVISSMETNTEGVVYAVKSENILNAINEMKKVKENSNIKIISRPVLRNLDRVSQIKRVQDYVFMIKGN
jgi:S1-C subfamily serine protease